MQGMIKYTYFIPFMNDNNVSQINYFMNFKGGPKEAQQWIVKKLLVGI